MCIRTLQGDLVLCERGNQVRLYCSALVLPEQKAGLRRAKHRGTVADLRLRSEAKAVVPGVGQANFTLVIFI